MRECSRSGCFRSIVYSMRSVRWTSQRAMPVFWMSARWMSPTRYSKAMRVWTIGCSSGTKSFSNLSWSPKDSTERFRIHSMMHPIFGINSPWPWKVSKKAACKRIFWTQRSTNFRDSSPKVRAILPRLLRPKSNWESSLSSCSRSMRIWFKNLIGQSRQKLTIPMNSIYCKDEWRNYRIWTWSNSMSTRPNLSVFKV